MRTSAFLLASASLLAACGGGQTRIGVFTTNWEDDHGASIGRLEKKLAAAKIPDGADVAVGIRDDGLVGVPLSGGSTWTFAHAITGRPDIAGNVVVASGGGEIFCLQASTGSLLWKRSTGGLDLIGAGDDGQITVVTLQGSGGVGSTLLAVTRDGTVVRQLETDKRVGDPAVVAGIAFVPWQSQYVSAYDVSSGDEIARVTLRSQTSHAFVEERTLYFGEIGVTRFDDKIALASQNEADFVKLPDREIVGTTSWLPSANERKAETAGATDKVRAYARPTPKGQPIAIEGGRYYSTYYRVVFGLDAANATLAWVHTHGSDVVGGAAYQGGVAVCDADGKITFLEAAGGVVNGELSLGGPVKACVVHVDQLSRAPSGKPAPPLVEQMAEALTLPQSDMVTAQRFLLREIARIDDPSATKVLVDLASSPRTSPALLGEVRSVLASRRNGADAMLAALERPYDFLHDALRPPPVGPIADALAAMKEPRGAAPLAKALNDPQTPPDDVRHAAQALAVLATDKELPDLEAFFALYRCTAENDDIAAAVVTVAETLVKIGGQRGKEIVARAAKDPLTLPAIKDRIASLAEGVTIPADPAIELKDDKKKPARKKG